MSDLLMRVPVGSQLTGFALPSSDYDWLEVYDTLPRSVHDENGSQDVTKWSLTTFMRTLEKGSHNALEACFAPDNLFEVDVLREFRYSFRVHPYKMHVRYEATAEGSSRSLMKNPVKHAIFTERLMFDVQQCWDGYGRYDPTRFRHTSRGQELYQMRLDDTKG